MTSLYSKQHRHSENNKQNLVLLHGWGAHSGVWQSVLPALLEDFNVTCIDLPGHGHSDEINDNSIDGWADAVINAAPENAIWLGWSLGGLVAQQVANTIPHRVEKLIMLASTPRFIKSDDWSDAVDEKVFRDFYIEVIRDPHASLLRFIALQTRGSKTAGDDSRLLKKTLLQPEPSAKALDNGMQLLLETDLRDKMDQLKMPVLWLAGERDTLVPNTLGATLKNMFVDFHSKIIEQAGHAAFLSHPEVFCEEVKDFSFKGHKELM